MVLVHVTGFKTKMPMKLCTVYNAEGADQIAQKHIAAGSLTITFIFHLHSLLQFLITVDGNENEILSLVSKKLFSEERRKIK